MPDIFQLIASKMNTMSKSQIKIAQYILNNQTSVPFFNINTMARHSQVSEATIVRFASFLGFAGYPQLQQELQKAMQKHLTPFERLEISQNTYTSAEPKDMVHQIFLEDIAHLRKTLDGLNTDTFLFAAEILSHAPRIFICANRSSHSLGQLLCYYLDMLLGNVTILHNINDNLIQLDSLTREDAVIGISFPRYSTDTVETFHYAREQGAETIAITDTLFSPLIADTRNPLLASIRMPAFLDSYVAPLSLINALIIQVSRNRPDLENRLKHLENLWNQYHAFAAGNGNEIFSS